MCSLSNEEFGSNRNGFGAVFSIEMTRDYFTLVLGQARTTTCECEKMRYSLCEEEQRGQ